MGTNTTLGNMFERSILNTDFSQRFSEVEGLRMQGKRWLNSDELGVSVFPSVYIEVTENPLTGRAKRQVNYEIYICEVVLLPILGASE